GGHLFPGHITPPKGSMCPIKSVRDVSEHCVRYVPGPYTPEGEGTDWGMLKILAVLFAARQRGVEDGAAPFIKHK
ncbi:hypothetical protein, partial [Pseudomonas helleri]|uniref:hypothetical protein n=1 Tax=Pseudomonas helleri TaxID=1608996 RepID=UPI003FD49CC4